MILLSKLRDGIISAWDKRNKYISDKDNILRIANAYSVKTSYVQRILGEENDSLFSDER